MKIRFKMMISIFSLLLLSAMLSIENIYAQDLFNSKIRKLDSKKKSIYLTEGVFHNGKVSTASKLMGIRHSYRELDGYERIVFDFETEGPPEIYGSINSLKKKIYIDFTLTTLSSGISSLGNSKYVQNINFFPIDKNRLSVEIDLKESVGVDLFFLTAQGRLVLDLK
jgi:hypothetical protein